MLRNLSVVVLLFFLSYVGNTQTLTQRFDELVIDIKRGSFADSTLVFKNGGEALKLAHQMKDPAKKALIYQYYGNFNFYSGKMDAASSYYDTSIFIASVIPDSSLIVSNLVRKTFIQSIKDPYNAESVFKKLAAKAERNNYSISLVECLNGLGIIYEDRQDHPLALEYYIKALKEAYSDKDPRLMGMLHNNIGLIKLYQDQFDDALEDFQIGLTYAEKSEDIRLPFNLLNNIGLIYSRQDQNQLALDHYMTTLVRSKTLGFPYYIAISFVNLSNSYLQLDDYPKSLSYADSARSILDDLGDYKNISKTYFLKSSAYLEMKEYSKALEEIAHGLDYAKAEHRLEDEASGNRLISRIYEAMGNYQNAFDHFKLFHELSDSLAKLSNTEKFQELQMAFNKERSDAEIEQERAQRIMIEKESQLRESRLSVIIATLAFLVIIIIIFFYLRHIHTTRRQQREFTQKLIDQLDEERLRISRDLHDDIGQSLSVVKSKLNQYSKGHQLAIDGLDEEVGSIINHTRSISHQLHPSALEKIGAKRAIISILDKIEKSTDTITSYEIDDHIDTTPKETQTQLYRILQECLNNTMKHAEAKSIRLLLEKEKDEWVFTYQDNGKGMDNSNFSQNGLGLQTIKERALKIGAKVQFQSQPTKGLKILLRFTEK